MAMTLRLPDAEAEALRAQAEIEGRSMQEIIRDALRRYLDREQRRAQIKQVLDEEIPRYSEALRRLGE